MAFDLVKDTLHKRKLADLGLYRSHGYHGYASLETVVDRVMHVDIGGCVACERTMEYMLNVKQKAVGVLLSVLDPEIIAIRG